jgi:hypothetical protein
MVIHFSFRGAWSGVKSSLKVLVARQNELQSNSLWPIGHEECTVLTFTLENWEINQHQKLAGCEIGPVTVRDSPSFLNDVEVAFTHAPSSTGPPTYFAVRYFEEYSSRLRLVDVGHGESMTCEECKIFEAKRLNADFFSQNIFTT